MIRPFRASVVLALLGLFGSLFVLSSAEAKSKAKHPAAPAGPVNTTEAAPRPDAWWQQRNAQINSRVKEAAGHVDLIFVGDSITQGWEGGGQKVWDKFYGKRHAANLGIGGDQTQHVLWRLDNGAIEGIKPKLAVVMIGTNNSGSNTSEEIAAGVTAIVQKLRDKLPETKILLLAIFPRGTDEKDGLRKKNEGANAIIAKLGDDKNVFFMDIGPKFLAADGKTLPNDVMPDHLHPQDKGYQIWAEAIEPKVKELMGESTTK
ncbi:MAG: GDSL family lipase [Planctomycetia bacterium]|nr:GDSL family lipase [Planctomycetia bacterium]